MAFDFNFWKAQIKEKLTGWKGSSDQLGSSFLYSFCASTTLWPLVDAVAGGNLAALGALFTTLQGVGGGLIANRINEWKNKSSVGELADELNRQIQDDDDLRNELDTLLEKLDTIELAKAGLEESDREWFEQTLRAELEQLGNLHRFEAHLSGTGAIAQSGAGPAVAAGEKGIAVGGDVKELHVHYGTEPPASNTDHPDSSVEQPAPASSVSHQPSTINHVPSAYLQWLADRLRYLDIRGMGINELTARFPLEEVYVDLKARAEIPPSDTNAELLRIGRRLDEDSLEKMRLAGRELTEEEVESMGRSVSLTAPLMDLFRNAEGLIILGDPGSGKTTFLKYLAMQLAEGHAGALGLENLLPILVPLSAYANALANGSGNGIKDFLVQYHIVEKGWEEEQGLKALFDEALDKGRALLLFDGLDEVRDDTQRKIVVERVTSFFSQHRQKGNRFVMTSRIVGYKEVRPQVEALQECTLLDFDEEEIESFADKWTGVLEKTVQGDTRSAAFDALKEKQELIDAVQRNEGVRRLAANPLLLTILALMKRQGITLPDRRVELYKIYVETLLKHWNAQREGAKDLLGTVKVLAPLAYWLQENSPGVGLARQEEVLAELARIYESRGSENPKDEAENLLDDVRTHTGLLLERGQGAYGFIHLTFQEYLAAVHVYLEGQGRPSEAVKILYEHLGDDNWHEVSLLAIGEVAINNKQERVAGDILEGLIRKCVQPARVPEGAILAGEAASDIGEDNIQMTSVDRVRETLTQCLLSSPLSPPPLSSSPLSPPPLSSSPLSPPPLSSSPLSPPPLEPLSHVQRVEAGRVLGKLGDARPEITLEGMQFCPVPAGAFLMGEEEEEGEYNVRWPFWMGRYPITNGQYQQFVEDGGYEMEALWKEAGEAGCWKDGHIEDWLGTTTAGPEQYGDPFGFHNHPVVGVTWYECLAFTRWLSRYWTKQATHSIPAGWEFRLPTEPEWEKAAKGGILTRQPFTGSVNADLFPSADMLALHLEANKHNSIETQDNPNTNRSYPWGRSEDEDACSPERLNFGDSDLHSTNAIGAYPTGASDYGCEEMSGGVWEWMMNKYAGYPYDPKDDREKVDEKEDSRVLRGGSFANGSLYVRCAYRGWDGPDYRDYSLGFRILCSPITSDL